MPTPANVRLPRATTRDTGTRARGAQRATATPARGAHPPACYVLCLYPEWFAAVLAGEKRKEYRERTRPDRTLEQLRVTATRDLRHAPRLLIFESRTRRCLTAVATAVRRTSRRDPDSPSGRSLLYTVSLAEVAELPACWPLDWRPQGVRCYDAPVWIAKLPRVVVAAIHAVEQRTALGDRVRASLVARTSLAVQPV